MGFYKYCCLIAKTVFPVVIPIAFINAPVNVNPCPQLRSRASVALAGDYYKEYSFGNKTTIFIKTHLINLWLLSICHRAKGEGTYILYDVQYSFPVHDEVSLQDPPFASTPEFCIAGFAFLEIVDIQSFVCFQCWEKRSLFPKSLYLGMRSSIVCKLGHA